MAKEKNNDHDVLSEQEKRTNYWLMILVRGYFLKHSYAIRAHGHGDTMYVQAKVLKDGLELEEGDNVSEEHMDTVGLILRNCPNYFYSPATNIETADFGEEWPPREQIQKDLEGTSKIILPGG